VTEVEPRPDWAITADALRAGRVAVVPTDTVYGVAAAVEDPAAVERLFALKGRDRQKPIAVLVADVAQAERIAHLDPIARRLVERFWPGALTLVLPRRAEFTVDLGGDRASVGLRCPHHPALVQLLVDVGPLAVTSANPAGQPTPATAAEAAAFLDGDVVVVDGGTLGGLASTVVDCTGAFPEVLRQGTVTREHIRGAIADLLT
jgi:L-threonylcarbamoyladenylate synthase